MALGARVAAVEALLCPHTGYERLEPSKLRRSPVEA